MKRWLCRVLRSLLHRLDGLESDDELRARTLGVIRMSNRGGTYESMEQHIREVTPWHLEPEFIWEKPGKVGDALTLTVVWR